MRISGTNDPVVINLVKALQANSLWPSYVRDELSENVRKAAFINDQYTLKEIIHDLSTKTGDMDILDAAKKLEKKIDAS